MLATRRLQKTNVLWSLDGLQIEGQVDVILGCMGSGKSTAMWSVIDSDPRKFRVMISTTTRAARLSDQPGEYCHIDPETFELMERECHFAWSIDPMPDSGNLYGTQICHLNESLKMQGWISLATLAIDALDKGAGSYIREGQIRPILLQLPNRKAAEERIRERGDKDWERRVKDYDRYDLWYDKVGSKMPQLKVIDAYHSKEAVAAAVREAILKP